MNEVDRVHPLIAECPVYEPGRPIETVAREWNLKAEDIVKLASNENPLGPSQRAIEVIRKEAGQLGQYPDGGCTDFRESVAQHLGLTPEMILPGNGSNEVLEIVATAYLSSGRSAVFGEYGFVVYPLATRHAKATAIAVSMPDLHHDVDAMLRAIRPDTAILFLASPNNPTGSRVPNETLYRFVDALPSHVLFCFDEAYREYQDDPPDFCSRIRDGRRILCVRTFSKVYGLAGLRIGFGYGPAEIVRNLNRVRQPFNVGTIAQKAAVAALGDSEHITRSVELNRTGRRQMEEGFESLGLCFRTTEANFLLLRVPSAQAVFQELMRRGVIVRPLDPYGLKEWLRISVGTGEENRRLLDALQTLSEENGALFYKAEASGR